ncbi:MAG: hypothetical protein KZQ97_06820 [Candidatus Thiodiazotropha sp. (ex Dulcina madagascariensis)]|nr:hypothetical protein [Candidatus Thiodiazotropha sp. (ex Dulcina madagascariensis)]
MQRQNPTPGKNGCIALGGNIRIWTLSLLALLSCQSMLTASPLDPADTPQPLKAWVPWVIWDHDDIDCPFLAAGQGKKCVWSSHLSLHLSDTAGEYTYTVTTFKEETVILPGSDSHWPRQVSANGNPAIVTATPDRPSVQQASKSENRPHLPGIRLPPGTHIINGRFSWDRLPDILAIPAQAGIVDLTLNGRSIQHPVIKRGALWLKEGGEITRQRQPEERISMRVFRLINDDLPLKSEVHIDLQVSGRQREMVVGKPLLEGFIPIRIDSDLPARLDANGELRVQVRPGSWRLSVSARHPTPVNQLRLNKQQAPWPDREVWSFQAQHHLRVVEIGGPKQIDPRQVKLPERWSRFPAYAMGPQDSFNITVIRRGNREPEPDQLQLQRSIWLDFEGQGYTLQDRITGSMTHDWRLDVDSVLQLGRAVLNGAPQFITRLPGSDSTGVEVRRGDISLVADLRLRRDGPQLPANGWGRDFNQLSGELNLPPGWKLLAATGVDRVPQAWLQKWTLYDLFLVLIATIAITRLWHWQWGVAALLTLLITWHEPMAPQMIWLYLLAMIAISRVAPAGKAETWIRGLRIAGYLALVIILAPFIIHQARTGLHPQLERYSITPQAVIAKQPIPRQPQAPPALDDNEQRREIMSPEADSSYELYSKLPGSKVARFGRSRRTLEQVDPSAIVQTGPGLPAWSWTKINLFWSGPVSADQRIGLYMLSPIQTSLLRFAAIGLVLLLGWRLLDREKGIRLRLPAMGNLMVTMLLVPLLASVSDRAIADIPDPRLLAELERRLTLPPECLPDCASIHAMDLSVDETSYRALLTVHARQTVAIPLPVDTGQVTPVSVTLNNQLTPMLFRKANQLWLLAQPGEFRVQLDVRLPPQDEVQIPLPMKPHRVVVEAAGWSVEGIGRNRVPQEQIALTRIRSESATPGDNRHVISGTALPSFFRVERTLQLGLDWTISTTVNRVTPVGTPVTLQLPLLAGESVVSETIRVKNRKAIVSLSASQRQVSWHSKLDIGDQIELKAGDTDQWIEHWRVDIGPMWHLRHTGIPPVHHQDAKQNWLPTWQPWPGEQVSLAIVRPEGVAGNVMTVSQSRLSVQPGKRVTNSELSFRLRASRGGSHDFMLPQGAEFQWLKIDGRQLPIRPENGNLALPVAPGEQVFAMAWRQREGIHSLWQTPELTLGISSVNANLTVNLAQSRWVLWTDGPRMGPAVLFWSLLLVVLIAATLLGRTTAGFLPLATGSWFLLGIGLTQVSIPSSLAVVAWFFLLHYRNRIDPQRSTGRFNLTQVGVVLLTAIFIAILFWAVQQGLLGLPAMQIEGNASSAYQMNWYQDRVAGGFPQATVISVPLIVYRGLMLLWALWLAFALLSWLKWGWAAFSKDGIYWKPVNLAFKEKIKRKKHSAADDQATKESST